MEKYSSCSKPPISQFFCCLQYNSLAQIASHILSFTHSKLLVTSPFSHMHPYAPWCWNIYLHKYSKITQFCRCLYSSTMVRIWGFINVQILSVDHVGSSKVAEKNAIEVVDLRNKMVIFHSFLYVYQRVNPIKSH